MRELVVTETLAAGSYSKTWQQVFPSSQLPKLIVMTMVRNDAFTGTPKYNPFHFQHFGVNHIQLRVNSKSIPSSEGYKPMGWTTNKFLHEYKTLESIGVGEHGISPLQYANGQFFMVWNLCPDYIIDGAVEPHRAGVVSLEIVFGTALGQPINIIMYAQFDNTLQIMKDKDLICD